MELACTYIETDKFEEVIKFYEQILQVKPKIYTKERWVEFNIGNKLAIYNINYDIKQLQDNNNKNIKYNQAYIKNFNTKPKNSINNVITLNFYTEDLNKEYERIKNLNICNISEIMYVNITEPYYYFNIHDPEGNILEICGDFIEKMD